MSTDNYSARCKACDKRFYPLWNAEHEEFEDLCKECLTHALGGYDEVDDDDYSMIVLDQFGDQYHE